MMVQRFSSSQAAPSARTGLLQPPIGLHWSAVQEFPSTQSSGVPGWQPTNGVQVSTPLQASLSSHTRGMPPVHTPAWHVPFVVHTSPQEVPLGTKPSAGQGAPPPAHVSTASHPVAAGRHTVPPGSGGWVQVPEPLQTSLVHALPSSPQGTNGVDSHASVVSLQVVWQSVAAAHGLPRCPTQSPV